MTENSMQDIVDTGALFDALTYHIALMMAQVKEKWRRRVEEAPNWRTVT